MITEKKLLSGLSSPPKRRSKRVAFDKERMRYGRIWVGAGRQDAKLVRMYNLHKCRVGLKASTKRVSF